MSTSNALTPEADEPQFTLFQIAEIPNPFRKAVQVVHSKPREHMSLMQRKISNAWLKNAVENPPDSNGWWEIGIQSMGSDIGFDSNNREYLKQTARELMAIVFEWDVIAKKKSANWKASVLYPEVEISGERIRYQISSQLRQSVLNPEMYALIDMNVMKKFRRASSLAIYEHCIRFERIGITTEVPWEQFRDIILGESTESSSYNEFKYFSQKVLKPSIAEINAVSDIQIILNKSKIGKSISHLWFDVVKVSKGNSEEPSTEESMQLVGEMVRFGVPQSEARRITKSNAQDEIKAAIAYTEKRQDDKRQPKLDNPAAYFRRALTHGWGIAEDIKAKPGVRPKTPTSPVLSIQDAYMLHQAAEAKRYFNELDISDQSANIERYNSTQTTDGLKIKKNKSAKAAEANFLKWLGMDTWGTPTAEQLVDFANKMMTQSGVLSTNR